MLLNCTIFDGNFTKNKSDGAGGAVCADGYSILYVKGGTFGVHLKTTQQQQRAAVSMYIVPV